jgi:acylphosphatase
MQTQLKRYSIILRGRVQHIGYRGIIEGTARKLDLKCYIFNDIDDSVKIVVEGLQKSVDNFLNAINDFARADIESIEQKEIHEIFPIPHLFSRVATDEYYEFGQKFDIGLDYLDGIKTDTGDIKSTLGDMKSTLGDMKGSLSSIDSTLGAFVEEQREHNQRMDEHNHRLDKILTKLAEK